MWNFHYRFLVHRPVCFYYHFLRNTNLSSWLSLSDLNLRYAEPMKISTRRRRKRFPRKKIKRNEKMEICARCRCRKKKKDYSPPCPFVLGFHIFVLNRAALFDDMNPSASIAFRFWHVVTWFEIVRKVRVDACSAMFMWCFGGFQSLSVWENLGFCWLWVKLKLNENLRENAYKSIPLL